jgi:hypothetical protein
LSRALPLGVGLILGVGLARHLYKHTPRTVAEVCNIAGVVMAVLILLAPNPRVGYLVYPINLFVWAYLLNEGSERRARAQAAAGEVVDLVDDVGGGGPGRTELAGTAGG